MIKIIKTELSIELHINWNYLKFVKNCFFNSIFLSNHYLTHTNNLSQLIYSYQNNIFQWKTNVPTASNVSRQQYPKNSSLIIFELSTKRTSPERLTLALSEDESNNSEKLFFISFLYNMI